MNYLSGRDILFTPHWCKFCEVGDHPGFWDLAHMRRSFMRASVRGWRNQNPRIHHHARVAERSIAMDCKSIDLWSTKVQILPRAQRSTNGGESLFLSLWTKDFFQYTFDETQDLCIIADGKLKSKGLIMNFEIIGKLFKRTIALSGKLQCKRETLPAQIYQKGLEVMEGEKPAHIVVKRIQSEYIASFIEQNWLTMSDKEIAVELGLSFPTIRLYRSQMGFGRRSGSSNGSVSGEYVALSEEEKAEIASRPWYPNQTLAQTMQKPLVIIKSYRRELAKKYIAEHPHEDPDVLIARKFGLNTIECVKLRLGLGFPKQRCSQETKPCELGTVEEIRFALTEGGYSITSLLKAKGLNITREGGRQIIARYGISGKVSQRKPLWYAHRLVGFENIELARNMANKSWITKQIAKAGGLVALAKKLGIEPVRLKSYVRRYLKLGTIKE